MLNFDSWGRVIYEVVNLPNKKQTSKKIATTASKILRDGRYSDNSKSVAGSALSQTKIAKKKSK
ncbi:MAG: hypothetical protein VR72_03010 [Clostridiaceae bacterium BRH_c20a]|nr:MAG: hypothetical protein VR72_03010 [Clostridiaceae bacterium BRH_c20a]